MRPNEITSARADTPEALLSDRTRHARAWKAQGGVVVGFMSNSVPIELIHAAGCLPLQLPPEPGATPHADLYMEELFDPMARSVFERLLRRDFDFVDLVVLPRAFDSLQRMYYYLCELRRVGAAPVPETFLYDVLQSQSESSANYSFARLGDLKRRLETLVHASVSEGALRASIALYNRIRHKLTRLSQLRRALPCRLPGHAALELFEISQLMRPDDFETTLDALLASGATSRPAPGRRIVLIGSAHDQPVLHRSIARAGGQVVGDYHWRGDLLFGPPIDEAMPPLLALSNHYHRDVLSPRSCPAPVDALVDFVRAVQAEAAVFYYYAAEEALTWDCVEQRAALAALGVPSLCLSMQAYPPTDHVDAPLQRFIAELESRSA